MIFDLCAPSHLSSASIAEKYIGVILIIIAYFVLALALFLVPYFIRKRKLKKASKELKQCERCGQAKPVITSEARNAAPVFAVAFAYLLVLIFFLIHGLPNMVAGNLSQDDYSLYIGLVAIFLLLLQIAITIRSFPKLKATCPNCGHTWTL